MSDLGRVRVAATYGDRFPVWNDYVGAEGVVLEVLKSGYLRVQLDRDDGVGLFLPDELEAIT